MDGPMTDAEWDAVLARINRTIRMLWVLVGAQLVGIAVLLYELVDRWTA